MGTWKLVEGDGAGGFLCPPGHPNLTWSVEEWARGDMQSCMGVDGAVDSEYVPEKVRAQARALLADAQLVESELWVRNVYGYMRNMWTTDGTYQNAGELVSGRPEGTPVEWHAAVVSIRKYFPDHAPRTDLIADPGKGYGSPPCLKCGERVQYEARLDALCVVRSEPSWSYNPVCTDNGVHVVEG